MKSLTEIKSAVAQAHGTLLECEEIIEKQGTTISQQGSTIRQLRIERKDKDATISDQKKTIADLDKVIGNRVELINRQADKIAKLEDHINEFGLQVDPNHVRVCTGCGHIESDELPDTAIACCPDSDHVPLREFINKWRDDELPRNHSIFLNAWKVMTEFDRKRDHDKNEFISQHKQSPDPERYGESPLVSYLKRMQYVKSELDEIVPPYRCRCKVEPCTHVAVPVVGKSGKYIIIDDPLAPDDE